VPEGVNFIYNPYFIAMGTVARDFRNPEFVLMGTKNGFLGEGTYELSQFYDSLLPRDTKYRTMTWSEAECTKVFYNTFISFKLSFVNMIQDVAMKMGDMNVDNVTDALCEATDRLISPNYMKAGMGDGGPCHPRDNIALSSMVEELGLGYDLFRAVMISREAQAENMARYLKEKCSDLGFFAMVVICGKSFKPGVSYIDGSYSVLLAHYLLEMGVPTCFHDECVGVSEEEGTEPRVYLLAHMEEEWHNYNFNQGSIVVDPWRAIPDPEDARYRVIHYGNPTR
jgi:UDPglucose 6-dehydrogenase